MADPIDELAQRWKQNPSPATTIALCDALRGAPRAALVQQVGEIAAQRFATDVSVLLSIARMYLEAQRFGDAQATLVAAGKRSPRDGNIYRWLGEALLRRGDADRAEKVLERSIQLGVRDADAQLWLERARVFRPMQAKAGARAVAAEVAHATQPRAPMDSMSDSTTAVHVRPLAPAPAPAAPAPARPAAGAPARARAPERAPVAAAPPKVARQLAPPTPMPTDDDDEPTRMGRVPSMVAARAPAAPSFTDAAPPLFVTPAPLHAKNAPTEPKSFEPSQPVGFRARAPAASTEPSLQPRRGVPAFRPPSLPIAEPTRALAPPTPMPPMNASELAPPTPMPPLQASALAPPTPMPPLHASALAPPTPMPPPYASALAPPTPMPPMDAPLAPPTPMPPMDESALAPPTPMPMPQMRVPVIAPPTPMPPMDPSALAPPTPMPPMRAPFLAPPTPQMPEPMLAPMQPQPMRDPRPAPMAPMATSPIPNRAPFAMERSVRMNGIGRTRSTAASDRTTVPHPRDVLDALALAGVYEPPVDGAAQVASWARPEAGPRRKGGPTLIVGMVLFLAASVGVYVFYRHKRAEEHVQAEAVLAQVEMDLHAGKPDALADTERQLAQAFQLESRSPRAALDWARERVLAGILKSGDDIAFEDAMTRAKDVGVPEEKYAFARVASFLFQGDTAGAAAVLPRWDGPAGIDPFYVLVAGATLERAGDARAKDRYAAAAKLDPDLFVASVAQARATAIDGDPQEAMTLARALRKSHADRAEPVALVALAWGRDANRESTPAPPEVDELLKRVEELPAGLRYVPHAILALRALDKRAVDDARAEVQKGLAVADSPGAAVWLGTIALPLGDEALARKGALDALHLSAVYEPARALAARVALLGDRLDEALKATEDLEATSPDVAVVRAASSYERVDADGVTRALDALSPDAKKLPFLAPLLLAGDTLAGKVPDDPVRLLTMAADDSPWSDLIAMDVALDAGDLATGDKIAEGWGKGADQQALRALRLARLYRYEAKLDLADAASQSALEHGTVTPRALWERVFVLTARNHAGEVSPMLARTPLVLGPLATWLSAYAAASNGSVEVAKGKTSSVDPPPATAPFDARVVAAVTFGAMKDKRRGADYVRDLLATGSLHPDLVAAALELGFHKVEHFKRKPTYE